MNFGSSQVIEKMERETGLEPATSSLGSWHSTTELLPHSEFSHTISHPAAPVWPARRAGCPKTGCGAFWGRAGSLQAPGVRPNLLQNLAVGRIAGIQPGALAQQAPPHPNERTHCPARHASANRFSIDLAGQKIQSRPTGIYPVRRRRPRRMRLRSKDSSESRGRSPAE